MLLGHVPSRSHLSPLLFVHGLVAKVPCQSLGSSVPLRRVCLRHALLPMHAPQHLRKLYAAPARLLLRQSRHPATMHLMTAFPHYPPTFDDCRGSEPPPAANSVTRGVRAVVLASGAFASRWRRCESIAPLVAKSTCRRRGDMGSCSLCMATRAVSTGGRSLLPAMVMWPGARAVERFTGENVGMEAMTVFSSTTTTSSSPSLFSSAGASSKTARPLKLTWRSGDGCGMDPSACIPIRGVSPCAPPYIHTHTHTQSER